MISNREPTQLEFDFPVTLTPEQRNAALDPPKLDPSQLDPLPPDDPWMHRSVGMRCSTCMWYVPKKVGATSPPVGRCRRHAPTMGGYPVVFVTDWCGDHKLNEATV